ncbi:MAG: sigma-70 family RNA polymerase sigma factor, partial [Solirubrobacterales bacterium]
GPSSGLSSGAPAASSKPATEEVDMYASSAQQQGRAQVKALAERLYREHYPYLLRIAAKNAPTHADAEEAVGEAFTNFVRAYNLDSGAPPLAWVILATKRSCWDRYRHYHLDRIAAQRTDRTGGESVSYFDSIPSGASGTEDLVAEIDEVRTQLAALKPDERTAISLRAAGFSYGEIAERQHWTFTKVNRCLAEGRAALRSYQRAE